MTTSCNNGRQQCPSACPTVKSSRKEHNTIHCFHDAIEQCFSSQVAPCSAQFHFVLLLIYCFQRSLPASCLTPQPLSLCVRTSTVILNPPLVSFRTGWTCASPYASSFTQAGLVYTLDILSTSRNKPTSWSPQEPKERLKPTLQVNHLQSNSILVTMEILLTKSQAETSSPQRHSTAGVAEDLQLLQLKLTCIRPHLHLLCLQSQEMK